METVQSDEIALMDLVGIRQKISVKSTTGIDKRIGRRPRRPWNGQFQRIEKLHGITELIIGIGPAGFAVGTGDVKHPREGQPEIQSDSIRIFEGISTIDERGPRIQFATRNNRQNKQQQCNGGDNSSLHCTHFLEYNRFTNLSQFGAVVPGKHSGMIAREYGFANDLKFNPFRIFPDCCTKPSSEIHGRNETLSFFPAKES